MQLKIQPIRIRDRTAEWSSILRSGPSRAPTPRTKAYRLLACLISLACSPALTAQGTSGCRAADQVRSPARLAFLKELVSSSDHVGTRQDLGIATMSANKVTLVTRQQDCQNAAAALNTTRQEPGKVRQVWLYALGTAAYAVDDPGLYAGFAARVLYFFNRSFVYKSTISGF